MLAREFRAAGLPLFVDLMLGLPGSTTKSFRSDLQQCIDREVTAKIFQTEVLVNSPMNDPEYRELHQIETATAGDRMYDTRLDESSGSSRALVVSTVSFTRAEYDEMLDLRRAFRLLENFGVLRHVTRYVRHETGVLESTVVEDIRVASKDNERWPILALTLGLVPEVMVPPISWQLFIEEVRRFVVEMYGVADDAALATVLAAQLALLPTSNRTFEVELEFEHDFVSWHRAMIEAKEAGYTADWVDHVPHLRELGPGRFLVDDPNGICATGMGFRNEDDFYGDWELRSPVSRAMPAKHQVYR